eukprot:3743203-Alexandrium_andersonii.AAC.1
MHACDRRTVGPRRTGADVVERRRQPHYRRTTAHAALIPCESVLTLVMFLSSQHHGLAHLLGFAQSLRGVATTSPHGHHSKTFVGGHPA